MKAIKGFTLFELIIIIVLLGILGATGTRMMVQGYKSYFTAKSITDNVSRVNVAVNTVMRELKSAQSIIIASASTCSFLSQSGQTIVVSFSGTTLTRSVNGGTAEPLCMNVIANANAMPLFAYYDTNYAATATVGNVLFVTMQLTVSTDSLPYSTMAGTVLRTRLPNTA